MLPRQVDCAIDAARLLLSACPLAPKRVGGLLEASLRRARACAEVSGSVHPSRCHFQRKTPRPRERPGPLPLARFPAQQPKQHDETRGDRVHAPLPAPCASRRFREDPALRTPCQPKPPTGAGVVPRSTPLHKCRSRPPAQRTPTGCTKPILPPVPMRNPASHPTFFRRSERRCGCSTSPRHCRLLLKATCSPSPQLDSLPLRFLNN